MKITDIFKTQPQTFSFEFFPPKDDLSLVELGVNLGQLMKLNPSFASITYGAGGSTQERTFGLVDLFQNKLGITTMAHYTCVGASKEKVENDLKYLQNHNIENLMLLRGDPPKGQKEFVATSKEFRYASDLITFAKNISDFAVGAGVYPEKHPEAISLDSDIQHLKSKVDAGADFLITQMFFDNQIYFNFVAKAKSIGINSRIIPGIIPITNYNQIKRFAEMSAATIPAELIDMIEPYQNNPAKIYQIGVDYAIKQCKDLISKGAPGIHFYTLNKSRATVDIFEAL